MARMDAEGSSDDEDEDFDEAGAAKEDEEAEADAEAEDAAETGSEAANSPQVPACRAQCDL